ncbi:MAG: amidase [Hydrogenophaga sp.]|jgi:Asp-tRNA(Asn)/Glu-tRNA(Gln) amidotransferase A subunit family amidase|nr:amidase [Hydrogenophaga sp.]
MKQPPLHRLGAADAARLLARREIRAVDLVRSCLDRIDEREPEIHAFVHMDADAALEHARRLDTGALHGLLHGLPLGVKDLFDTYDMPSSYGSPIYAGHMAMADAAVVAICREAGAVVLGKTVTTEFATFKPGPTRNPYDLARTPGGSSSGSAAAVADYMLPLALGTQTAASIVRPAAYCGVVGFKPSFGRVPRSGMKLLSESLDTVGCFGRSVEDAALMGAALTGDKDLLVQGMPELRGLRIGLFQGTAWDRVSPETVQLWEELVARMNAEGIVARDVPIPSWFSGLSDLQADVMAVEASMSLSDELRRHPELLSANLMTMLEKGQQTDGRTHSQNMVVASAAKAKAFELFRDHDVLLAPSAAGEAGWAHEGTGDPMYGRSWSLIGLPCLHLPLGRGKHGMPLGFQLIGKAFGDANLLSVGASIQRQFGSL